MKRTLHRPVALQKAYLPAFGAALLILLSAATTVWAHGGGTPQRLNEPSGPYLVSVWTDPEPLRTNDSHINVAVLDPITREPLLEGIRVQVEMSLVADPAIVLTREATTEQSTIKTLYVAVFDDVPRDGRWQVSVSPDGPEGSGEPILFEVDISPPAPPNYLRLSLFAFGALALIAVVALWLRRSSNEAPAPRRPRRT